MRFRSYILKHSPGPIAARTCLREDAEVVGVKSQQNCGRELDADFDRCPENMEVTEKDGSVYD